MLLTGTHTAAASWLACKTAAATAAAAAAAGGATWDMDCSRARCRTSSYDTAAGTADACISHQAVKQQELSLLAQMLQQQMGLCCTATGSAFSVSQTPRPAAVLLCKLSKGTKQLHVPDAAICLAARAIEL
jgi:hypothetical protein